MLLLEGLGLLLLLGVGAALMVRWLNHLPPLNPRRSSTFVQNTEDTPLGRGVAGLIAAHPGLSGVHLLEDGPEAFAARVLLARAAVRSLDIQYYIWENDLSGTLMLHAILEAADRGVRVRMLLDDNGISGMDPVLSALNQHPNVEIRLFNPFIIRRPKMFGYLVDFSRLNRRMHNKSFTADNQATIIGGRNIGDEYFGAHDDRQFSDLDALAIGPVVEDVSRDFDRYWSSPSAYPAEKILRPAAAEELAALAGRAGRAEHDPKARAYIEAIRGLPFIRQIEAGSLPFEWARIRMISDDPAKGVGKAKNGKLLATALLKIIGEPERELRLISGYFVPTHAGVNAFSDLARRGVDVSIFTNAFEATDVWIVHAGYAERRKALLRAGIRLFEMRRPDETEPRRRRRKLIGTGSGKGAKRRGYVLRSSGTTLHAKTFAVDRQRLFIGSFNFDPRSMQLNTELGFVIESAPLAEAVAGAFDADIPSRAYEVLLADDGRLVWREDHGEGSALHTTEPGTSLFQRAGIRLLSRLPIEWLL